MDIVEVRALSGYKLHLRFENGREGFANLERLIKFDGVFAPLKEEKYFCQARLNRELGTVVWPNGADLDPDVLYAEVTGHKAT